MRKTMNISVHDDLHAYILDRARTSYFGSISEYIRWLVRCDQTGKIQTESKEKARTRLRSANETVFVSLFQEFMDHYFEDRDPEDV